MVRSLTELPFFYQTAYLFPSFLIVRQPFYGTEFETLFCLLLYTCSIKYLCLSQLGGAMDGATSTTQTKFKAVARDTVVVDTCNCRGNSCMGLQLWIHVAVVETVARDYSCGYMQLSWKQLHGTQLWIHIAVVETVARDTVVVDTRSCRGKCCTLSRSQLNYVYSQLNM